MKRNYRYQSIFTYGSLQSAGHMEEYFSKHTRKLVIYIVMPRLNNQGNLLRIYQEGRLVKEEKVWSSGNFFFYYLSWLWHNWKFTLTYFGSKEKFIVLSGHPIFLFGMSVHKLLRPNTLYAYWIGDYFPPVNLSLRLFEKLKKYYHDRVSYAYYLSDTINKIFNGGNIMNDRWKRTVMWGVKPIITRKRGFKGQFNILFVGLLKEGQGIEVILTFLANHSEYALKIIGICSDVLFRKYQALIGQYEIGDRVFFPNKFYSDTELESIAKDCHVGIALYDIGKLNATYYTDPGKVKTYMEMGLPVIMSRTSAIAPYVSKFGCGEIIDGHETSLTRALTKIQHSYTSYCKGLKKFVDYFYFETYYKKSFRGLAS